MVSRYDKTFIITMLRRNRRRRDATLNPPAGSLGWIAPPPATGAINVDHPASWENGEAPYYVRITSEDVIILENKNASSPVILNTDTVGRYDWLIVSADGQRLVGTTFIS